MERLIVLAFLWFVVRIIRSTKKAKAPTQKKSAAQAPVHIADPAGNTPITATQPSIEPSIAPTITPRLVPLAEEEPCEDFDDSHSHEEGQSHVDASGCVGGSLGHLHDEGFVPEGPGMLAAMHASPESKLAIPKLKPAKNAFVSSMPAQRPEAKKPERLSAASVRRAFITAEIIGKPVSMRKSARV